MRDPARIEKVLARIRNVWYQLPDMRLGQLLVAARRNSLGTSPDIFYDEDEDLAEAVEVLCLRMQGKQ